MSLIMPNTTVKLTKTDITHHVIMPAQFLSFDYPFETQWFADETLRAHGVVFCLGWDEPWCKEDVGYEREVYILVHRAPKDSSCNDYNKSSVIPPLVGGNTKPQDEIIISSCRVTLETYVPGSKSELPYIDTLNFYFSTQALSIPCTKTANLKRRGIILAGVDKDILLTVHLSVVSPIVMHNEPRPSPATSAHSKAVLEKLLGGGCLSDVTLEVGGERLRAHRAVLAANSPVFEAMFVGNFKEKSAGTVQLAEVRPELMRAVLVHAYGGGLPAEGFSDARTLTDLLQVADRFQIADLKAAIEGRLLLLAEPDLDPVELLLFADTCNSPRLRNHALTTMVDRLKQAKFLGNLPVNTLVDELHQTLIKDMFLALLHKE